MLILNIHALTELTSSEVSIELRTKWVHVDFMADYAGLIHI